MKEYHNQFHTQILIAHKNLNDYGKTHLAQLVKKETISVDHCPERKLIRSQPLCGGRRPTHWKS